MENKSKPLTEGKIKTNVKNTTECIKAAPPPPPLPKHKMMENKQTAVEWLIKRYEEKIGKSISNIMEDEIKQAKAMEREQIDDLIDKISSLTGYLKLWRDGKKLPLELNDLIDESDYFTKTYQNGENS